MNCSNLLPKSLVLGVLACLFTVSASAAPWTSTSGGSQWREYFSCEGSSIVVDIGNCTERGCEYQLVLRHREAITYFLSRWAFSERHLNARGEFIVLVQPNGENDYIFFDGEENWSVSGRNLFRLATVKGSDAAILEVRFLRGFGGKTSDNGRIADWTFHGCQLRN